MSAALDHRAGQTLNAIAAAYRECRAAIEGLRQPWADLRDPVKPWEQTLLLLHDRHQIFVRAAREVEASLDTACELYADQRELGYHQRDRSLIEHLKTHPDLRELVAANLHPDPGMFNPFSLVEYGPHYIVEDYPDDNRVVSRAQELIGAQRAYIHTALNPR